MSWLAASERVLRISMRPRDDARWAVEVTLERTSRIGVVNARVPFAAYLPQAARDNTVHAGAGR